MAWFKKKQTADDNDTNMDAMWSKCNLCNAIVYKKELQRNLNVCSKCGYHFTISAQKRLEIVVDQGTFKELDQGVFPVDAIHFRDLQRYSLRLKNAQKKTGMADAFITGNAQIGGLPSMLGLFEFGFLGGDL